MTKKEILIKKIRVIDDEMLLNELYRLMGMELTEAPYQFRADQIREVEEAREQLSSGKGSSSEDVERESKGWLKE